MELSIVIPVYNEEQVIPELYSRLLNVFEAFKSRYAMPAGAIEVLLINDGSKDNSLPVLIGITRQHHSFKVLNLSKNFGHQIAATAGIEHAEGNAIVLLDADLQDPPEFILDLYDKFREGYDVVYAKRKQRKGENFFKLATAKVFYRLMRIMTNIDIPMDTGDFRIMSRNIVDVLKSMKEKHRFLRGMVTWIGFKQIGLYYERNERFAGRSKYPLRKMIKFAWDAITSFSSVPLRIVSYLGIFIALLAFLYGLYVVYVGMYTNEAVSGWSSLMVVILLMSGINLITLGLIGEYIGRISEESKNRPLYIIEKIYKNHDSGI